jgi:hypothetical protein
MNCPGCNVAYAFSDHLSGRFTRCRECNVPLTVRGTLTRDLGEDMDVEEVVQKDSLGKPRRRKKRSLPERTSTGMGQKLAIGLGVLCLLFFIGLVTLLVLFLPKAEKGPRLAGKWRGNIDVSHILAEVGRGKRMDPAVKSFAQGVMRKALEAKFSPVIEFKKNGQVFCSGNTKALAVPELAEGTWEVISREADVLTVRMKLADDSFEARLAFRDKDTFLYARASPKSQTIEFARVTD